MIIWHPFQSYRSLESYVRLTEPRQKGLQGPDSIPGLLLKENADLLTPPTMDILNTSVLFCRFQAISLKAQKGTFLPVGSDVLKSAKMVPFLQLEVMLLKVRKRTFLKI